MAPPFLTAAVFVLLKRSLTWALAGEAQANSIRHNKNPGTEYLRVIISLVVVSHTFSAEIFFIRILLIIMFTP
jgi:hypothetical protein